MERMVYRGFASTPKHSAEDGMFYGTVDGVDAVVMYDSETEAGLEAAFMEAVDTTSTSAVSRRSAGRRFG